MESAGKAVSRFIKQDLIVATTDRTVISTPQHNLLIAIYVVLAGSLDVSAIFVFYLNEDGRAGQQYFLPRARPTTTINHGHGI